MNVVAGVTFDEDDITVFRAKIPGVDPDEDVDITVHNGVLTIAAEREERTANTITSGGNRYPENAEPPRSTGRHERVRRITGSSPAAPVPTTQQSRLRWGWRRWR